MGPANAAPLRPFSPRTRALYSQSCLFCRDSAVNYHIEEGLVRCKQCDLRCHHACLYKVGLQEDDRRGWFCTGRCASSHYIIGNLVGNPIDTPINIDGSCQWSVLNLDNKRDTDMAIALFASAFTRKTATNVVNGEDDYAGFYSAIVYHNEEIVSAAAFRLHRSVAEIAYVATLETKQRMGFCRRLMHGLEQHCLAPLGIEEIVLHSLHNAFNTWRNFGYVPTNRDYRIYNLLQYSNTITCRKLI